MTVRSFQDACRFLFPRSAGGIKWGLETTETLLGGLGRPDRHFASLHIGGTNGKGSTASMLAAILRAAGLRVGLYTSPHLVSFRERILVDDVPITEDAVATWVAELEAEAVERDASFFEITTVVAFADFAARGVEIAVVEVGLGGRLDATNVVTPLAAGVTRIAVEHTDYLGPDRPSIAREKAGIAKRGVPFVATEHDQAIAALLLREAEARGAVAEHLDPASAVREVAVTRAGTRFTLVTPGGRYTDLSLGLVGTYQAENAALAVRLAELLPAAYGVGESEIRQGLCAARVPGRFDWRGRWLFDVAHNPDGMRALAGMVRRVPPPRPLAAVVAVLADKEWREMLRILGPVVDRLVLTRAPSAPPERAWDLAEVAAWARAEGLAAAAEPDFDAALRGSLRTAATVLVTGSFHTVGDAMARLPGTPPLG